MDGSEKLLQGIAAVLWPVIILILIVLFRPAVSAIVESAKSRKFTLKVGGQELTMEEASATQRNLIADLQEQVSEIRKQLAGGNQPGNGPLSEPAQMSLVSPTDPQIRAPLTVLWVDDNPKNNGYFVEQLRKAGYRVDTSLSTSVAVQMLSNHRYSLIISDMGRQEGATYNPSAGIDLLLLVRKENTTVPFIIYCSSQAAYTYGKVARAHGATAITSSPTELFGILNLSNAR